MNAAVVEATLPERRFLVYGLGVTNRAVITALTGRGLDVVVADDGDADELSDVAAATGAVAAAHRPDRDALAALVERSQAVVPAPGLADRHPLFALAAAAQRPVLSEFDLAGAWDGRPVVAVTGTNGKTTVTTLLRDMLVAGGIRAAAVGNLDTPLVAAIDDRSVEVFAVEASSFRLARSRRFRPRVAVWLNFAEDHLDVHSDLASYRAAKERIVADQGPGDLAVLNADDPTVAALAARLDRGGGPEVWRFSVRGDAELDERDGRLRLHGDPVVAVGDLWSPLPHDRANVLAAAGAALRMGAPLAAIGEAAAAFDGLAHRVQLVAEVDGVRYYDDSKATAPHATLSAVDGFESVVLIAGGRNKGLDLGVLAGAARRVRAVVGIGESAGEVLAAFPDRPGVEAGSMREAVRAATGLARPGDTVLLSPACASFDWYGSYAERGDDFARSVADLATEVAR